MIVRAGIHTELRQIAVAVALYGSGLAVGQHIQTARHGILVPHEQLFANRCVDCVGSYGVHRQPLRFEGRLVVEEETHPQRVVVREKSRIQISGVRRFQSLVLAERHLRTRHHRHRVVTNVSHGIPGPPFVIQLDALEIVCHQISFHKVAVVVVVEGVKLIDLQAPYISRITHLRVAVVAYQLQGIVA